MELGYHQIDLPQARELMLDRAWRLLSPRLQALATNKQERLAMLNYLWSHLRGGFQPEFMLTCHSKSPAEYGCSMQRAPLSSRILAPSPPPSLRNNTQTSVLNQVTRYNALERRRNDPIVMKQDALHLRKVLHREFWFKATPKQQRIRPHLYFFHELGRAKLQYHTHVLFSMPPGPFDSVTGITAGWKNLILPRVNSLSTGKDGFHVKPLPSLFKQIGEVIYLTKEVSSQSCILDPEASLVLQGV